MADEVPFVGGWCVGDVVKLRGFTTFDEAQTWVATTGENEQMGLGFGFVCEQADGKIVRINWCVDERKKDVKSMERIKGHLLKILKNPPTEERTEKWIETPDGEQVQDPFIYRPNMN